MIDSEHLYQPEYPVSFEHIEDDRTSGTKTLYIGNTGGKYEWFDGLDHFRQHFMPDAKLGDKPISEEKQRQYSTLYPAVLHELIEWQDKLDDSDPRKHVDMIKGGTNKVMSDYRQKLLGEAYTYYINESKPGYEYEYKIDLNKMRSDIGLLSKLKRFADRARSMDYKTIVPVPKSGKMRLIHIKQSDL